MKLHRRYIKSYKKNTLAILFSISLTIALVVCFLAITHTDDKIQALQYQYTQGGQDCSIKELNVGQVSKLQKYPNIEHLALSKTLYEATLDDKNYTKMVAGNRDYILLTSKLLKGRIPHNGKEVVAERWALANLGIKDKINTKFTLKIYDSKSGSRKAEYTLVGIISDNASNKTRGVLDLYAGLEKENYNQMYADIKFSTGINVKKEINRIKNNFNLKSDQILYNQYVLDETKTNFEFSRNEILLILLITGICAIVIAGVYRISILSRISQYGILKSLGMKQVQILKLIAGELYDIYLVSIPIGVAFGLLISYTICFFSNIGSVILIFWGKEVPFQLEIPVIEILCCIIGIGIVVGFIALIAYRQVNKNSIVATIFGVTSLKDRTKNILSVKASGKLLQPFKRIAIKYVFRDIKSTLFIILSISIGSSLFVGVYYQAYLDRVMNYYEKQVSFLNWDYELDKVDEEIATSGISENTLKEVRNIKGITSVETQMTMPIRVVDNVKVKRNNAYFNFMKDIAKGTYYKTYSGNDGVDKIYKSELNGYNKKVLKELHKYILEGDYNPNNLNGNEAIIFMPLTIKENDWRRSQGYFKNGAFVMKYKIGDVITIKYRTDLNTNESYWNLMDKNANYTYKKFKISTIVYYPYMRNVSGAALAYPAVIISEEQFKKIINHNVYSRVNVNVNKSLKNGDMNDLEDKLIQIAYKNQAGGVTARSIINQKMDLDNLYHKQLVYSYGIAIVVLVLVFINVINNLKYRIRTRKMEMNIYRAIGMNYKMVCKMIRFENLILGLFSILITIIVSGPITKYLYGKSDVSHFNVMYHNDYRSLTIISILIILICYLISNLLTRELRNDNIVDLINDIE